LEPAILHNIALLDKIDEVVRDWKPASILYNIAEIDRIELIVDRQSVSIGTISSKHASRKGQFPDGPGFPLSNDKPKVRDASCAPGLRVVNRLRYQIELQ